MALSFVRVEYYDTIEFIWESQYAIKKLISVSIKQYIRFLEIYKGTLQHRYMISFLASLVSFIRPLLRILRF